MIASIRIGVVGSMVPVGVKCSSPDRCPSWKIQTTTPKVADRDAAFITIALTGSTTDPKARNSSTNVASTTTSAIHGSAAPRRDTADEPDDSLGVRSHRTRGVPHLDPRDAAANPGHLPAGDAGNVI